MAALTLEQAATAGQIAAGVAAIDAAVAGIDARVAEGAAMTSMSASLLDGTSLRAEVVLSTDETAALLGVVKEALNTNRAALVSQLAALTA